VPLLLADGVCVMLIFFFDEIIIGVCGVVVVGLTVVAEEK